ncbi:MAG: hypothetical protein ACTHNE_16230 [Dyella sp.]|uniref:hypothetical protein n=1 Tax=Dyella sp. TaxID=1869338 RepID=UPI003F7DBC3F
MQNAPSQATPCLVNGVLVFHRTRKSSSDIRLLKPMARDASNFFRLPCPVRDKTTMHDVFQGSGAAHKGKSQDGLSDLWVKHEQDVTVVAFALALAALTISSSLLLHTAHFSSQRLEAA